MTVTGVGRALARGCALLLPVFTLVQVNYPTLRPQTQLAVFAGLGVMLGFLRERSERRSVLADLALALASGLVFGYIAVQTEPLFSRWWLGGRALGERAGLEHPLDIALAMVGLLLVLEAARRAVGWALPILAMVFLLYGFAGPSLPAWLLPHRGYDLSRLAAQVFLHGQGVFGIALRVMFTYVFLFVLFGALLEATGTTRAIVTLTRRLFRRSVGGPAKVAVLSSGLMGSLSGSAVANTATTGTFTIPMMRGAGFRREIAAGIEAAASSGGALVPPVMGAGAYMMLELIEPAVTYLEIVRAALVPAILYYLSLLLLVHFYSRRSGLVGRVEEGTDEASETRILSPEVLVFVAGLGALIALLLAGFSVFRAVTGALATAWLLASVSSRTRVGPRQWSEVCTRAARATVPLIAATACVGVVIGVVTLTGVGTRLPALILALGQGNLLAALGLIMVSSIILGMGLPSAVCYLLMATLIGPALNGLGIVPLAAHLFIFYFGMMSMVTPPVALAAYTAGSIAGSKLIPTSFAALRFALVGFALPFLFVYRPALLMLSPDGTPASLAAVARAVIVAVAGIVPLAAALGGHWLRPLAPAGRATLAVAAVAILLPPQGVPGDTVAWWNLAGAFLAGGFLATQWWRRRST
ncbi:MAG: TRAP transporter fused permease subunit [Acidobacteria bacterium]|nr:TRAP transporter fused permease subunit [Acidobacteriota bacterium]